jgi:hypothetical protein
MRQITSNKAGRMARKGNLKEWFVGGIRQRIGKWGRGHRMTASLNVVQEDHNPVDIEPELGTAQHFRVFGQDPSVHTESDLSGGHHAYDFGARTKRGKESSHKDVRIEDYLHFARLARTALTSASISSIEILSVPC